MSELITNLNSIYQTKLQIKEAIGTDSDIFADYPTYISGMVTPSGYAYVTANGDWNISSYEMVNVDVPVPPGYIVPEGTSYITTNGDHDISSYAMVNVNVPSSGGQTIAQKNAAWQTKWATALSTVAAGLYAQDPSYGEPQISDPSGWCIQTSIDGNAAMSEMLAMACLWLEIYGGNGNSSILHEQYVQIFTQMGLNLDSDGYLVSTDDDKILPFDADEAMVTNWTGVNGFGTMGGKKISSLNGGIENAKWDYYGLVFNGTGFDYVYLGQLSYVVNQFAMINKMSDDGVTFINNIPAVNQTTLFNYLKAFQIDEYTPYGTMNITTNGTYDVEDYASAYVSVAGGQPSFDSYHNSINAAPSGQNITYSYQLQSVLALGPGYVGSLVGDAWSSSPYFASDTISNINNIISDAISAMDEKQAEGEVRINIDDVTSTYLTNNISVNNYAGGRITINFTNLWDNNPIVIDDAYINHTQGLLQVVDGKFINQHNYAIKETATNNNYIAITVQDTDFSSLTTTPINVNVDEYAGVEIYLNGCTFPASTVAYIVNGSVHADGNCTVYVDYVEQEGFPVVNPNANGE